MSACMVTSHFIHEGRNFTRCYMVENRSEMFLPPLRLLTVLDQNSTVNVLTRQSGDIRPRQTYFRAPLWDAANNRIVPKGRALRKVARYSLIFSFKMPAGQQERFSTVQRQRVPVN